MDWTEIEKAEAEYEQACHKLNVAVRKQFPLGTQVWVEAGRGFLTGLVIEWWGAKPGEVAVQLINAKGENWAIRSYPARSILKGRA